MSKFKPKNRPKSHQWVTRPLKRLRGKSAKTLKDTNKDAHRDIQ